MKKILETCLMIMAAYAFFGFVYPELCLTGDTCAAVEEDVAVESEKAKAGSGTGKSKNTGAEITAGKSEKASVGSAVGKGEKADIGSIVGKGEKANIGSNGGKNEKAKAGSPAGESEKAGGESGEAGPGPAGQNFLRDINSIPPEQLRIRSRLLKHLCKENEH